MKKLYLLILAIMLGWFALKAQNTSVDDSTENQCSALYLDVDNI